MSQLGRHDHPALRHSTVRDRRRAGLRGRRPTSASSAARRWPNQVGIREAKLYRARPRTSWPAPSAFDCPHEPPFPDADAADDRPDRRATSPTAARTGSGSSRARSPSIPAAWFFQAHFHQDPVWPGSLGLESFLQLLKVVAVEALGRPAPARRSQTGRAWTSRTAGSTAARCCPTDREVTVQAVEVTAVDDARRRLTADGFLTVDGRIIYQMNDFTLE